MIGLSLLAATAIVTTAYEPRVGTAERAAIMDAIRADMGASAIFKVRHLRVRSRDGLKLAYAEVDPHGYAARPYEGWALVSYLPKNGWRVLWGVRGGGTSNCRSVRSAYNGALKLATDIDPDQQIFSRDFIAENADIAARNDDEECVGEVVAGASWNLEGN